MLISKKLINKYLPQTSHIKKEQFISTSSDLTFEIEQILTHPKLNNLVIGELIEIKDIPNSKHLHLTKVKIDQNKVLQIVCGAKNLLLHQKVVVALNNAKLYNGRVIHKCKFMGYESQGMLCALNELTPLYDKYLPDDEKEEILNLNQLNILCGSKNVDQILGLDDEIYDVSLPTNRHDLSGALSVINEWSKYYTGKEIVHTTNNREKILNDFEVQLSDKLASFYFCAKIDNFANHRTDWQIKNKLFAAGIKVHNQQYLDQLNWATYLTGVAPLIFDANKTPKNLKQHFAKKGDQITINGCKYELSNDDVVLSNTYNEIVALDGVGVDDKYLPEKETNSIYLYVSNLRLCYPRNSSIRLNVDSLASKYSRNKLSKYQINLFISQIKNIGKIVVNNNFNNIEPSRKISFDLKLCQQFIDNHISDLQIKNACKKLCYQYDTKKKAVMVPGYRFDLQNQYDLCEEILKVYSINTLPAQPIIANEGKLLKNISNTEWELTKKVKNMLVNNYFYQAKTYNLTAQDNLNSFNFFGYKSRYQTNPCVNKAREFLRLSTIDNMLKVISYNRSYKLEIHPIFELQKIYENNIHFNLTCIAPEKLILDNINNVIINFNTFGLKDLLRKIENIFHVNLQVKCGINNEYLYTNDCGEIIYENKVIGYLGCIKNNLLKSYKLQDENLYLLTINLEQLINQYDELKWKTSPINLAPIVYRDVTFNANDKTNVLAIVNSLKTIKLLKNFHFFKAYTLDNKNVAYTIHLSLQNTQNSTLSKQQIDEVVISIFDIIEKNHGEIRK